MRWLLGLTGYLEIILWGDNPERILNMALSRGIYLWDIEEIEKDKYSLKIRLGGFKAFAHLVRRSECRMKINKKRGAPFRLKQAKQRKALVLGALFFCIMLCVLSSFVWQVDVVGNEKISEREILEIARKEGLKEGVPISSFNRTDVKDRLALEIPELAWVGIHVEGTKVTIEVAEKTVLPPDEERKPADIIAGIDGRIEEMLILTGTPVIKEGDKVSKGQVLILGVVYPQIEITPEGQSRPLGEPQYVRAKALVRARVQRYKIGTCPIVEEVYHDTGEEVTVIMARCGDKEIVLAGPKNRPYQYYRTISQSKTLSSGRNPQAVVELITVVYVEQKKIVNNWGIEGAYQEALRRVKNDLAQQLPNDYRIIASSHEPLLGDKKGEIRIKYMLETIEDIGCPRLRP